MSAQHTPDFCKIDTTGPAEFVVTRASDGHHIGTYSTAEFALRVAAEFDKGFRALWIRDQRVARAAIAKATGSTS